MKQTQKDFCVDLVNVAVFNGILEDSFIIKNNSHNRFAGTVTLKVEDDPDRTLYKIDPKGIWETVTKICNENIEGLEDETEKNVLLANKRLDANVLEPEDILFIFHLICFGEV